jgi:cytochrome b subunit of formate dehydrogenase/nitrate/TMAO reductase-like tetraheme cytochrome c subunit
MILPKIFAIIFLLAMSHSKAPGQEEKDYETRSCQSCHQNTENETAASVHGKRFLESKGLSAQEAEKIADCLACHSKHGKDDPEAANSPFKQGKDVAFCGSCHLQEQAYYFESYHGRHFALKKSNLPTCTYCHVGHEKPLDDPKSFLHFSQVGNICAGCHGGSDEGKIAMAANLATPATGATLYGSDVFRLSLPIKLFYSITGFLLLLFLITSAIEILRMSQKKSATPSTQKLEMPFKIQVAFFVALYLFLDTTGTAFLYSYDAGNLVSAAMSKLSLISMKIYGTDDARSLAHRLAGLSLALLFLVHLTYVYRSSGFWRKMLLRKEDIKIALQEARLKVKEYSLENHRWKQKFAYWLVLFLTTVMIFTGGVQWFAFSVLESSQLQVIRYARLIHDWNGLLLSITIYGVVILYFTVLKTFAQRRS